VYQDEEFHRRLLKITRNEALAYELNWIGDRIHFVRGVDLRQQSGEWLDEHSRIAAAMVSRDAKAASMLMQAYLARLMDDLRATLKIGIGELYIG
jgi:DNA-binding FadR family transcriptional regulator